MKKIAVVATVLGLLAPATARAHPTPTVSLIRLAIQKGEEYWGHAPCNGTIDVRERERWPGGFELEPGYLVPRADMWASFATPQGPNDIQALPATYTNCMVHVSREWSGIQYWSRADIENDWGTYCQLVAHEVGHFEGYDDRGAAEGTVQYIDPTLAPETPQCQRTVIRMGRWRVRPFIYSVLHST